MQEDTESEQMLAIKGIGCITVAGFLAEVGDVRRFESPRQIQSWQDSHYGRTALESTKDRRP